MTFAAPTRTWGLVAANVKRTFGDESGAQLEEGDLVRWINQGQYEIARANKVLKARGQTMTAPGQSTYSPVLSREIQQIESLRYGKIRLVPTEFTTIDANLEEYPEDAKGDPRLWYKWGNDIVLWPAPKASVLLDIYFTAAPKTYDVFDPARVLEIPDNYYLPLIDFVMARAHEMDDNAAGQQVSTQLYAERLASMNDEERGGQTLTFQTITIVD
jgi:hypothetical protein